ncbi:MAG: hypothetical protein ABIQ39_05600 [Ilumatobacteraceae bacterium]
MRRLLRSLTRAPGVPKARHVAERALAPYLRADLQSLHEGLIATVQRLEVHERELAELHRIVHDLETHMPAVLNAISSTNGTTRLLRREFEALREEIGAHTNSPDG